MSKGLGKTQQKILVLLLGGLAIGLSRSPRKAFQILDSMTEEWKDISKNHLKRAIKSLYESKMIKEKYNKDGTTTIILTVEGKKKALTYNLLDLKIAKPKKWDGRWRIVLFDIPEKRRKERDSLRYFLRDMGFFEYQKSVFVHPYDCENEIDYIIEDFKVRKFVRFVVADKLDNELHLKKHFDLL
ncbi:CRISPR-associated endonuclease Cas2 [Patescibacteria group bacterium]